MATTTLDYLIPRLRLKLGDIDSSSYRYLDSWLLVSLQASIETLQRWWNYKYLVDNNDEIYRNTTITFLFEEPPVIERGDIEPIILMASIIIKSGSVENFSWNLGAWRDAEISYSNIEGGRSKLDSIKRDWEELINLLTPPTKRLAFPVKSHLQGYGTNDIELGPGNEYTNFLERK